MTHVSRTPARIGAIVAVVALFSLVGTMPASAHTGHLFTVQYGSDSPSYFATIGQADGAISPLATAIPDDIFPGGVEICNEQAYAIANQSSGVPAAGVVTDGATTDVRSFAAGATSGEVLLTWDHNTGAAGTPLQLTQSFYETDGEWELQGLDALADCTLISILTFIDQDGPDDAYLVSIDPLTGELTELVDFTAREGARYLDSLATDPTTGISYALVDENTGLPEYLILNIADGSFSGPFPLTGVQDALGDGYIMGADFDTAGTLWFYYESFGETESQDDDLTFFAGSTGEFGAAAGATLVSENPQAPPFALAYDPIAPVVKAELPNTGLPIAPIGIGGIALLIAGVAVVFVTRRRATV